MDYSMLSGLAGHFAAFVGLVVMFKQERGNNVSLEDFMTWLKEHSHDQLNEFISKSSEISASLEKVLRGDHEAISDKLTQIDKFLAVMSYNISAIGGLAKGIYPSEELLSEQAIGILRQLVKSNSSEFHKYDVMGSDIELVLMGRKNPDPKNIVFDDYRYLDDDLETLVDLGFLRRRYAGKHNTEFYGVTREAQRLIDLIDGPVPQE